MSWEEIDGRMSTKEEMGAMLKAERAQAQKIVDVLDEVSVRRTGSATR